MDRHHLAADMISADNDDAEGLVSLYGTGPRPHAGDRAERAAIRREPLPGEHDLPDRPRSLAALLRDLRQDRGLTLSEVGDAVGVAKPTVWAWEKGRARPTRDKWSALAGVLGIQPERLAAAIRAGRRGAGTMMSRPAEGNPSALLAAGREMIARAYAVEPSAVRIIVEV